MSTKSGRSRQLGSAIGGWADIDYFQMAEVPLKPATKPPVKTETSDRKYVIYFLVIVVVLLSVYAVALLLMYWTDSLLFKPFVRELPANAFWLAPPGGKVRSDEEIAARVAFIDDYLDLS